ncbi:MAG: TlpA family protein disulfide reductase [Dehalococcoidia bacterium]|nr:TlpA family protein disulfide reductase [Dehalococcoidia bacterium]
MKFALPVTLTALFCAVLLSGCSAPTATCPKIGDKAPDFTLSSIDGREVSLNSYAGKAVIINTWDVDCAHCDEEMPFFQELYDKYTDDQLVFLSIDTGYDSTSSIKEYLKKNNYTFSVLQDYGGKVLKPKYCFTGGNPYTVFIDSNGIIKHIQPGSFPTQKELDNVVQSLIEQ